MLLVALVGGAFLVCILIAFFLLSGSSSSPNTGNGGGTGGPVAPGAPLVGGYVQQHFNIPKCGWYGCFFGTEPSSSLFSKKWLDIGGLKGDTTDGWPSYGYAQMWNPYATSGVYFDGGVRTVNPGDLPTVNPPKDRVAHPYNMDPLWQQGSTDLNEYYKKHCKIKIRGTLGYQGPNKADGGTGGHYSWRVNGNTVPGQLRTEGRGMYLSQPRKEIASSKYHDVTLPVEMIQRGEELPPWWRRGPHSLDTVIRQHCK